MEQSGGLSIQPHVSKPRRPRSAKDWDEQRSTIQELYVTENRSLVEVVEVMEKEYGFQATERQYKTRISQWHLDKKVKASEMQFIVQKGRKRKVHEDKDTVFRVRGRTVEPEKIDRAVKRKKELEDVFMSAPSPGMPTPSDISYFSPPAVDHPVAHSPSNQPATSEHPAPVPTAQVAFHMPYGQTPSEYARHNSASFSDSPNFHENTEFFLRQNIAASPGYWDSSGPVGLLANTPVGHDIAAFPNLLQSNDSAYLFPGQSPVAFPSSPGNGRSHSSLRDGHPEAGNSYNTDPLRFTYKPEIFETKLTKLIQLIKESEEIKDIDYMQVMFEVNSLVYDFIVFDESKFNMLFVETPNASNPTCHICKAVGKIGNDKMEEKVESERLLLEAIAVSEGRLGKDHIGSFHFKYNLFLLYSDWDCRLGERPTLLAELLELAIPGTLIGAKSSLRFYPASLRQHALSLCQFEGQGEYADAFTSLGRILRDWSKQSAPNGDQVLTLKRGIWEIIVDICDTFPDADCAVIPLFDLLLRLEFSFMGSLGSEYFWAAVVCSAIRRLWKPIFNSRQVINNAMSQASSPGVIVLKASLDQLAEKPYRLENNRQTISNRTGETVRLLEDLEELAIALIEVSLAEIEKGGNFVLATDTFGRYNLLWALEKAAELGNSDVIALLASQFKNSDSIYGTWDDILNHDGELSGILGTDEPTPLGIAAKAGHEAAVKALIDAGADVNGPLEADQTPLMMALEGHHHSIATLLIKEGADVTYWAIGDIIDSSDRVLQNLGIEAVCHNTDWLAIFGSLVHIGNSEQYDLLDTVYARIRKELGMKESDCVSNKTLPLLAKESDDFLVGMRLTLVFDCEKDNSGRGLELLLNTLTGFPVEQQARQILGEVLVQWTKEKLLPKLDQSTKLPILHLLVSRNAPNALSVYLGLGAHMEETDDYGRTALHFAADQNRIACARILLRFGAKLDSQNGAGQTARDVAVLHGHKEFQELLSSEDSIE